MKFERSAGVLLFREADGQRLFLLLDYGSHWDFPKGHVEAGEDDVTAARRELQEETGIVEAEMLDGFAREISYIFRSRKGGLIKKAVIFYLASTRETNVMLSHEHVGYEWLPADRAIKRLSYATARSLMESAVAHLRSLS